MRHLQANQCISKLVKHPSTDISKRLGKTEVASWNKVFIIIIIIIIIIIKRTHTITA